MKWTRQTVNRYFVNRTMNNAHLEGQERLDFRWQTFGLVLLRYRSSLSMKNLKLGGARSCSFAPWGVLAYGTVLKKQMYSDTAQLDRLINT